MTGDRIARIADDLDKLDAKGKYSGPSNIVAGDPHFARSLELEYGLSIEDLRRQVALHEARTPGYRYTARYGSAAVRAQQLELTREYCGKVKALQASDAFYLLQLFEEQLTFLFEDDELTGLPVRNLDGYAPAYRAHILKSIAMAKHLGLPHQEPTEPICRVSIPGVPNIELPLETARQLLGDLQRFVEAHDSHI